MVETSCNFPFRRLRQDTYLVLEILMHVERHEALNFIFALCKEARAFLKSNFIAVRNGFINEGLVTYYFEGSPEI